MITEATQKTVQSLLTKDDRNNSYQYIIPPYQREYSWKEEQWENLFNDIYENEQGYFLGSIICISSDSNKLDVIDGQQRLTTLNILLLSLYKHIQEYFHLFSSSDENNYLKLKKYIELRECFKEGVLVRLSLSIQNGNKEDYEYLITSTLSKEENCFKPQKYATRRIARAFKYFYEKIDQELKCIVSDDEKIEFLFNLLDKINSSLIVKIDTKDASSAFILFESINNRGMSLTPIDLIKNNLISKLSDNNKPEETNEQWQKVIDNINAALCSSCTKSEN